MKSLAAITSLAISLAILSACNRVERAPMTAEDLRIGRQAMPISEVLLMLRGGYKEQVISSEIMRRHISVKPDAAMEEKLIHSGASPKLIEALKSDRNILTENQKEAYDKFAAEQASQAAEAHSAHQRVVYEQAATDNADRQRRQYYLQQTLQNTRDTENRVAANERASQTYKAQKASLENQIAVQEAYVNRLRSNGYRESEILAATKTLDRYKEDLAHLQEPPLR